LFFLATSRHINFSAATVKKITILHKLSETPNGFIYGNLTIFAVLSFHIQYMNVLIKKEELKITHSEKKESEKRKI